MNMDIVDLVLQEFNDGAAPVASPFPMRPVGRAYVFDDIDSSLAEQRKKNIKTCPLMPGYVRTVVQHNVQPLHLSRHISEKLRIVLRTDPHAAAATVESSALGIDVNSKYHRLITEKFSP